MIASLAPKNFDEARELAARVPAGANAIEWRLDLAAGRLSPRALLDLDPRCAILTWRTRREGGSFEGSVEEYARSVRSAYDAGAVVDVELESGLLGDPAFLPDRRRVIGSRHGAALSEGRLRACFAHDVAAVKLVLTDPDTVAEAVACVERTRRLAREKPVACFATGPRGTVSRVLAVRFGGSLAYGSLGTPTADGQIGIGDLLSVYRGGNGGPPERIFAIYAGDASRSLSPRIHNALFRSRGLSWLYVPLSASRRGAALESPIAADLVALDGLAKNLWGVSVTNPFKGDFGAVAEADAETAEIGAANTLVRRRGECLDLSAHNTDVAAVREALAELPGKRVLVRGSGGAARAALAAAAGFGRSVAVAARNADAAAALGRRWNAEVVSRAELPAAAADVLVNATPLGGSDGDEAPFPAGVVGRAAAVVDFVYCSDGRATPLVASARAAGKSVVDGLDLLARQAVGQARLFGVPDATREEIAGILRGDA